MRLLHRILTAISLTLLALPVIAQNTTTITLSHLLAGGVAVPYAQVCASPSDANGNAISVSSAGWGFALKNYPFCANVVNGALPSGLQVPDAAHTTAASPIRYNIRIQVQNANGISTGSPIILTAVPNITGTTFPLDDYTPTVSTTVPPNGLIYTSGLPASCTDPSIILDRDIPAAYMCVDGVPVPLAIATSSTYATTAGSADTATTAGSATNADHATLADTATNATYASTAGSAASATSASYAANAGTANALAAAPAPCTTGAATGINADGTPKSCISVSGAAPAGSYHQFEIFGTSSAFSNTQFGTDSTGEDILGLRNLTGQTNQPLQLPTSLNSSLSDYVQASSAGVVSNSSYPQRVPNTQTYNYAQRFGSSDSYGNTATNINIQSGTMNLDYVTGAPNEKSNVNLNLLNVTDQAANQAGGEDAIVFDKLSKGDLIEEVKDYRFTGRSDPDDEDGGIHRNQMMAEGGRFGMTLSSITEDAFTNWTFRGTLASPYGENTAEEMPYVDLSKDANASQAGNISNIVNYAADTRFSDITPDSGLNILTVGTTSVTSGGNSNVSTLTAAITGTNYPTTPVAWVSSTTYSVGSYVTYSGSTWRSFAYTNTGNTPGAGWQWQIATAIIEDPSGVGGFENVVASVANASVYTASSTVPVCIAGAQDNFEQTYITAVNTGANTITFSYIRHPHASGEMVSQGGTCGYGIAMTADDLAVGALGSYGLGGAYNTTTLHNVYPIVGTIGGHIIAYVDAAGTGDTQIASAAYSANTPLVAGTLSAALSGGLLSSVAITNSPNYHNITGGTPQQQTALAYPTIAITGLTCSTNPSVVVTGYSGSTVLTPIISIANKGAGCTGTPTATMQSVYPNPYHLYPMTYSFRVIDPSTITVDPATGRVTGNSTNKNYLMTEAINPSNWATGDLTEIEGWFGQSEPYSQEHFGFYYGDNGGREGSGAIQLLHFEGTTPAAGYERGAWNDALMSKYWNASGPGPRKSYLPAPGFFQLAGAWGTDFDLQIPLGSSFGTTPITGGTVFHVGCLNPAGVVTGKPCDSGVEEQYNLFTLDNISGGPSYVSYDNLTKVLSTTALAFQAPNFIGSQFEFKSSHGVGALECMNDFYGVAFTSWGKCETSMTADATQAWGATYAPVVNAGVDAPAYPAVNVLNTAGSTTVGYSVTSVTANGETTGSPVHTVTTSNSTFDNQVQALPVPGASSYNFYRVSGGATQGIICSAVAPSNPICIDTGQAATGSATTPASNTTGKIVFNGISLTKVQGTDSAVQTAGVMTGSSGTQVCVDGNGGTTTSGCTAITQGSATLTAGTVTVSTSSSVAVSGGHYSLTNCGVGGTQGMLSVGAVTVGTSFVINSSSSADTSTVCWWIR